MAELSEDDLKKVAKEINNCFDNGCGCCSRGDDDLETAVLILRDLIQRDSNKIKP